MTREEYEKYLKCKDENNKKIRKYNALGNAAADKIRSIDWEINRACLNLIMEYLDEFPKKDTYFELLDGKNFQERKCKFVFLGEEIKFYENSGLNSFYETTYKFSIPSEWLFDEKAKAAGFAKERQRIEAIEKEKKRIKEEKELARYIKLKEKFGG